MKDSLTIGECAAMSGLSKTQIRHYFDLKDIGGYYIPGSKHRRVLRASFEAFLAANSIPNRLEPSERLGREASAAPGHSEK